MTRVVCRVCGGFIGDIGKTPAYEAQQNLLRHLQAHNPETKRGVRSAVRGIRLPIPMLKEVDRLVETHPEMAYTGRQQFIESAVREKIERLRLIEQTTG
jgi:hypothetical protein